MKLKFAGKKIAGLAGAVDLALENGHNGAVIVEDYLEFESHHSSADPFTGANRALGDMFLQFPSRQALDAAIADTTKWLEIKLS